jgi:hypothetical protein
VLLVELLLPGTYPRTSQSCREWIGSLVADELAAARPLFWPGLHAYRLHAMHFEHRVFIPNLRTSVMLGSLTDHREKKRKKKEMSHLLQRECGRKGRISITGCRRVCPTAALRKRTKELGRLCNRPARITAS